MSDGGDDGNARRHVTTAPMTTTRALNVFRGMTPAQVALWARKTLALPNLLVLDTETTGYGDMEMTEIGLIDGRGATVVQTLVRARGPINPFAARLTGISDAMLADAPHFAEIAPALAGVLRESVVLIYNASFDCRVLEREFARLGSAPPPYEPRCMMLAYAAYRDVPDAHGRPRRAHSLGNACQYEGITHSHAHRVLGDCRATLALLRRVAGS
jgi:DNA polymerase-3 subunit epsilon